MDPRSFKVYPIAAPLSHEEGKHYLQRFWEKLPDPGQIVVFDRSWYGRVLVERVEGIASKQEWQRGYEEINQFERMLVADGVRIVKCFLHITPAEQIRRFKDRVTNPLKRWKLSSIDLVTRLHYADYTAAREAMLSATHTKYAPWTLVDFNDQRRGHLTVIQDFLRRLPDTHCADTTPDLPPFAGKLEHEQYGVLEPIPSFEG